MAEALSLTCGVLGILSLTLAFYNPIPSLFTIPPLYAAVLSCVCFLLALLAIALKLVDQLEQR